VAAQAEDRSLNRGTSTLAGLTVRLSLLIAVGFLVAGFALFALAAAQLGWPDLLAGNEMLTYGRVFPAGTGALLFGWVTVAFLGFCFHRVPRLVGAPLAFPLVALGSVLLVAGGAAAGVGMVLLGEGTGGRWLEFPLFVDGALVAGAAAAAGVLVLTARRGARQSVPLPAWFLVAGPVWLFLALGAAAIPGLTGLASEVQSGFTGAALFGAWAATAGVGVAYTIASDALGTDGFNERLGRIGFWSLGLTWLWTATRGLQFGPTPDWIETIPVVFGAGLVVAVLAIVTDFASALRGRWAAVWAAAPLQMAVVGLGFLLAGVTAAFLATMRSVSAVVQFTPWSSGVETALLLGAFTLFAMAGVGATLGAIRGRVWGRLSGAVMLWPVLLGVGTAVVIRLIAGVQQGLAWVAGAQSGQYAGSGVAFGPSAESMVPLARAAAFGLGFAAIGVLVFALRALLASFGAAAERVPPELTPATQPLSVLLRGAVAVFALAAVGAFAFPAIDSSAEASVLADATRDLEGDPVAELGRELYVQEGCWYCHTQQVREVRTDLGLGPVSQAGDYAHDPVGLAGLERIGPDLTHVGLRDDAGDAEWLRLYLLNPSGTRPWSVMPSYAHLTGEELSALAAYLSGLQ
jgi:cbb3-type cytochrome oxidase subunit 1